MTGHIRNTPDLISWNLSLKPWDAGKVISTVSIRRKMETVPYPAYSFWRRAVLTGMITQQKVSSDMPCREAAGLRGENTLGSIGSRQGIWAYDLRRMESIR